MSYKGERMCVCSCICWCICIYSIYIIHLQLLILQYMLHNMYYIFLFPYHLLSSYSMLDTMLSSSLTLSHAIRTRTLWVRFIIHFTKEEMRKSKVKWLFKTLSVAELRFEHITFRLFWIPALLLLTLPTAFTASLHSYGWCFPPILDLGRVCISLVLLYIFHFFSLASEGRQISIL